MRQDFLLSGTTVQDGPCPSLSDNPVAACARLLVAESHLLLALRGTPLWHASWDLLRPRAEALLVTWSAPAPRDSELRLPLQLPLVITSSSFPPHKDLLASARGSLDHRSRDDCVK